jgi:hypothetical protein
MSVPVFPALTTLLYPRPRTPIWQTVRQKSISGQETALQLWTSPQWRYELSFDVLRSSAALQEWQSVVGLFNQVGAGAQVFAYNDPADSVASQQPFGVGDGATTSFQLVRALGGFVEPVYAPVSTNVYTSDWQGETALSAGGRTNLLAYSQPSSAHWTADGTLSTVSMTAPDGSATCTEFVEPTGAAGTGIGFSPAAVAVSAGEVITQTIWAKAVSAGSKRYLIAFMNTGVVGAYEGVMFDLVLGTATSTASGVTGTITAGTSGWFRCSVTATVSPATTTYNPSWRVASSATDLYANNVGDGVSGFYLYAAQIEAGPLATSYIPTTGSARTVTDYSVGTTGSIVFTTTPAAGTVLLWSGSFNWLCRFDADEMKFSLDYAGIWSLKSCIFTTVKL